MKTRFSKCNYGGLLKSYVLSDKPIKIHYQITCYEAHYYMASYGLTLDSFALFAFENHESVIDLHENFNRSIKSVNAFYYTNITPNDKVRLICHL